MANPYNLNSIQPDLGRSMTSSNPKTPKPLPDPPTAEDFHRPHLGCHSMGVGIKLANDGAVTLNDGTPEMVYRHLTLPNQRGHYCQLIAARDSDIHDKLTMTGILLAKFSTEQQLQVVRDLCQTLSIDEMLAIGIGMDEQRIVVQGALLQKLDIENGIAKAREEQAAVAAGALLDGIRDTVEHDGDFSGGAMLFSHSPPRAPRAYYESKEYRRRDRSPFHSPPRAPRAHYDNRDSCRRDHDRSPYRERSRRSDSRDRHGHRSSRRTRSRTPSRRHHNRSSHHRHSRSPSRHYSKRGRSPVSRKNDMTPPGSTPMARKDCGDSRGHHGMEKGGGRMAYRDVDKKKDAADEIKMKEVEDEKKKRDVEDVSRKREAERGDEKDRGKKVKSYRSAEKRGKFQGNELVRIEREGSSSAVRRREACFGRR